MKRNQLNLKYASKGPDKKEYIEGFNYLYNLNETESLIYDFDSDLEELFDDSLIKYIGIVPVSNIEYNEDMEIIDGEYKKSTVISYQIFMQEGIKYKIPEVVSYNGCVWCGCLDLSNIERIE